uniref:hypothetical protein n=1 Tax=Vibrio profundi TaxID=1774960 RepID=UPI0037353E7C
HHLIELPDRRTLVAAKVWVSPYPIGVLIIHTKHLRVIPNAWYSGLLWVKCLCHNGLGRVVALLTT